MPRIVYQLMGGAEKVLELGEKPLIIGRLEDSDIPVADPFISRVHCGIFYRQQQFHLKDLGSSNGTYRNGARIFECVLTPGDRIQVGNTTLLFLVTSSGGVVLRHIVSSGGAEGGTFAPTAPQPPQPPANP